MFWMMGIKFIGGMLIVQMVWNQLRQI